MNATTAAMTSKRQAAWIATATALVALLLLAPSAATAHTSWQAGTGD